MAVSTWLSPTLPDEQAEPADKATPSRSKAIWPVSDFSPGKVKKLVFATLATDAP
jgi:hypothetical protein